MFEMAYSRVLESNERRDTGLEFLMSVDSRVGFFRSGFTVAFLKEAGIKSEVRRS